MRKSCLLSVMCTCVAFVSFNASAAIIAHGALSTNDDGSTNTITDALNNYEWLRFDILAPLTYAETVSVLDTQDGGGWNIAGRTELTQFIDAVYTPAAHNCGPGVTLHSVCGDIPGGWFDGDFGDNYDSNYSDYAWFLTGTGDVGYIWMSSANQHMEFNPSWGTIDASDQYAVSGSSANTPITWLLYRPAAPVTVPISPAVWLFGSGLLGLIGIARRKKSA